MKAEVLAHFSYPILPCVALVLFVSVFAASIAWIFRKNATPFYARLAELPLKGDQQ